MESIENKMPDLTEREKKVLNKHTKSIINQLIKRTNFTSERTGNGSKVSRKTGIIPANIWH